MPDQAVTVTDTRFSALKAKLRELFELDKSDLDFGIYRIMAAKNAEVTAFLDRQLKDVVHATLAEHGAGATDQVQAELDKTIAGLREAGLSDEQIDQTPKVVQLRAQLASAGGSSAADLEADIYNHLLNFFSRYYDEGDFISKRRYKGDTYAIPYSGEEVVLHWANKDQYYIKSGEWHKDYRFRLPAGQSVHFRLVEATQETGNNKEPDESKRRYILDAEQPIDFTANELTLRFQFRAPPDEEKTAVKEGEATRIFGGKYDKPSGRTQGDEREQFCADAEKRCIEALTSRAREEAGDANATAWTNRIAQQSPTEAKPARTILGKHLEEFTARNTFDYFIHKDLGGFLSRELDFYIKNEVVRLDDLDSLPADHLQRVQGRVKAIRRVAGKIIEFLAAIENFQKKMWLKKKFVLETNWLVTIDRVPDQLRDIVAVNEAQWREWEALGFKPDATVDAGLFGGAEWGTRAYLDVCDKLAVDTRFFDRGFREELLTYETVLGDAESIEEATTGVLLNGDNFHALGLLENGGRAAVDCVYIDPPYNAKSSEILYKNTYKHASWLSLMDSRLSRSQSVLSDRAVFVIAIDEVEQEKLGALLESHFPEWSRDCIVVNHNPSGQQGDNFSFTHEYCYFVHRSPGRYIAEQLRNDPVDWDERNFRDVTGDDSLRTAGRNCFYPIYVRNGEVVGFGDVCADDYHPSINEQVDDQMIAVFPVDPQGIERKWRFARQTVESVKDELKVHSLGRRGIIDIKRLKKTFNYKSNWTDARYSANNHGTQLLNQIIPDADASFPKSLYTTRDAVHAALNGSARSIVLDYFAGSGTTGHAVLALNREDQGSRRFILAEVGRYFYTVLRPRITKVVYSPEWRDGKAQSHDQGVSTLVKCFAIESYEDALNNLPRPGGDLLANADEATRDSLITYSLDLELGPSLLNLDAFRDPWNYSINAQLAGEDEAKLHRVDLVETFNYLIGLKVKAYGPLERYSADFQRREHADDLGGLTVEGRLRRDDEGPYVFQRVEGELNDGNDTRILVVWRKLTDDAEKDAAVLEAWMERHRQSTTERSEFRDYHAIYINGPITLPQPTQDLRTVLPLEQTFKDRMFEDTEGV